MRELKFRAWDSKWFYSDSNESAIALGAKLGSSIMGTFMSIYGVLGTCEQYTGIKDKNGKEIYEGDICRILYTDWSSNTNPEISLEDYKKSISSIGRIEYHAPEFSIIMRDRYGDFSPMSLNYGTHGEIEVIGNIHQNPELITL